MTTRPHIAFVIPSLSVGGTEMQLLRLIRGLQESYDVTLIALHAGGALVGDVRRLGASVRTIHARGGWDFTAGFALYRMFRKYRPHIVHTFLSGFDLWADRAARQAGVPVVISSRRELATWMKRRHVFMQRRANRYVDRIVANSRAVADFACAQEQADPALFRIIYNGINADDFVSRLDHQQLRKRYRIPAGARHVVGMVANFSPVKDHTLFVDMATHLLSRRKDVHFLFVGTGARLKEIHDLILKRDLRAHFDRVITVNEMADLLAIFDISVLCSKTEGFPNALLEAMAAGKPVVAPAVGGIPELVRDGETGRLVQTRNPEDFSAAVEALLDHPEERLAMGTRASAWVREHYSVAQMVRSYRELYGELLSQKMSRPASEAL